MNKEWSELNKVMQNKIKRDETYKDGLNSLFELRNQLFKVLEDFYHELSREEFDAIPFINVDGYHNKTIIYSIYHIFRIEDIVVHELISNDKQIFFIENYQERMNSPIITTGNELVREQITEFSKHLNLKELYSYISDVKVSTEKIIKNLSFGDLKRKIPAIKKECLKFLHVVSDDEKANWLIDYWCSKDVLGLIKMPLSRHWIMHIEACLRIKRKIHS
ncbi:MAG: hypothetical protein K2J85_06135, partial [Anaeroplasmataceae bacterium]|nr:hypothetical protein [Anaeroplasmataceae bacterium]